jgi:hypothetical protein
MLSQLYGVFFGFHLTRETNFIMQGKFSPVPGYSHMESPSSVFIGSSNRDYVVLIRDVCHFKRKDGSSGGPQHSQKRINVKPTDPFSRSAIELLMAGSQTADGRFSVLHFDSKKQILITTIVELSHLSYNFFVQADK